MVNNIANLPFSIWLWLMFFSLEMEFWIWPMSFWNFFSKVSNILSKKEEDFASSLEFEFWIWRMSFWNFFSKVSNFWSKKEEKFAIKICITIVIKIVIKIALKTSYTKLQNFAKIPSQEGTWLDGLFGDLGEEEVLGLGSILQYWIF